MTLDMWLKFGSDWMFCLLFLAFLWSNRIFPPTSEADYGQTVHTIKKSLKPLYRIGSEILCTNFCEIQTKSVRRGAESVFWREFKMADNLSDANGRGLYGEMRHDPRNSVKNKFWFYDLWFKSYNAKRKVGCYSATMRPTDVIIF